MEEECKDLPEECWELIFNRLDQNSHLEALSLVCKRFLSISDHCRLRLAVIDPTILVHGTISRLIFRFQNLKSIDLSEFRGHIDDIVLQIACSSVLSLEDLNISNQKTIPIKGLKELGSNMKSLKVLKCANLRVLRDTDLAVIANSLPWLEELDIRYPSNNFDSNFGLQALSSSEITVTDSGIEVLSSNLRDLRKLDISGNYFITDRSLVMLSSNCVLLREIAARDCSLITHNGIDFMLRNSPNLSSVAMNGLHIPPRFSVFEDSESCTRALCSLDFHDLVISDEFLFSIAKASIPLKKLSLSRCMNFTFSGLSLLLCAYQSIECLALIEVNFLTDQSMSDLSQYVRNLVAIKLNLCFKLTNSTFFTLTKNCPLLKDIEMERTNLGKEGRFKEFVKNPRIKSLNLGGNSYLSDECLKRFASICPSLERLDVCSCSSITEEGIAEILKNCHEIRHLKINDCRQVKNIGTESVLSKLEVLCAARSGFNDEGLETIGSRCCGLLKLDLEGCKGLTRIKVEEMVTNCERLREINLKWCRSVDVGIVERLVFSRPSLRKIIPPCNYILSLERRKIFLRHGCLVCEGPLS